jgi:hypothetical protein
MTRDDSSGPRTRVLLTLVTSIAFAASGRGQTLIPGLSSGGGLRLHPSDLAILESQEPRRELACVVKTPKPELGFDFMFDTGFEVHVPIREVAGDGNELTVVLRIFPQDRPNDRTYMVGNIGVPALEHSGGGDGTFHGNFTLGEGKYHVDWLMRDRRERICSTSWDLEAKLSAKDSQLRQWIPQSLVKVPGPLFASEPPLIRTPESGSPRLNIIVNFDPSDPFAAVIDEPDVYGLLAILRRMGRDLRIELHSIIICSFEAQQVVYRQGNEGGVIDLPALGEALRSAKLGTVDAKRLVSTSGPSQFAADLIRQELGENNSDALVVLGAKGGSETGVSRQALESFDGLGKPAFYLSYVTGEQGRLWRDPISSIMKHLRGLEYRINRPRDFFNAWSDVVTRTVRAKAPKVSIVTAGSGQ